jgi:hypothetical protein
MASVLMGLAPVLALLSVKDSDLHSSAPEPFPLRRCRIPRALIREPAELDVESTAYIPSAAWKALPYQFKTMLLQVSGSTDH